MVGFANKTIVKAIKSGNTDVVQAFFEAGNDVNLVVNKKYSYLYYSIKYQQENLCYLLLKEGANPNKLIKNKAPLFHAIEVDNNRIVRYLIEFGANVNWQDSKLISPLIKAVKAGQFQMTRLLIERGANPFLQDKHAKIAYDYTAKLAEVKAPMTSLLRSIQYQIKEGPISVDYKDGPYLFWESDNEGFLTYYERFGSERKVVLHEKTIKFENKPIWIKGFKWDKKEYYITKQFTPSDAIIETDGNVFVMGDIHGNLDGLLPLLMNNGIIDEHQNWIFKNGHFIVLGDFVDRGTKVTETLWFLRNLQQKAQQKGGNVHVLLGNHEIMTMDGDHRYLNSKYIYISRFIHKYYYVLYYDDTELGMWLRSLNSVIKVNDVLYSHAGFSPDFAINNYSLDTINHTIRQYLSGNLERTLESKIHKILGEKGPFWYRGYQNPWKLPINLSEEFIDTLLNTFNVNHLVIGHNEREKVSRTMNGKLLSIDVNMGMDGKKAQGLLIENKKMYRCYSNGTKVLLEEDDKVPLLLISPKDEYEKI